MGVISQSVKNTIFRLRNGNQQFPTRVVGFPASVLDFRESVLVFRADVVDCHRRVTQLSLKATHFAVELYQPLKTTNGRRQRYNQKGQDRCSYNNSLCVACDH